MIRTLTRVLFGFILACLAAGLTTVLFVTTPADLLSGSSEAFPEKAGQTLMWGLLTATHSAIFAAAFALITTGIAEWLGLRGLVYYLLSGAVIAMLGYYAQYASESAGQPTILNSYAATAFVAAGLVAGLVYWAIAGRWAGGRLLDEGWDDVATSAAADRPRIVVENRPEVDRPKRASTLAERVTAAEADVEVAPKGRNDAAQGGSRAPHVAETKLAKIDKGKDEDNV